jgi:hypothetical protein
MVLPAPYALMQELLVSPQLLDQHKIPYVRAVQNPGEFMINYPGEASCAVQGLHLM